LRFSLPSHYTHYLMNIIDSLILIENRIDFNIFFEIFLYELEKKKYPFNLINYFNDVEFLFK
jgi:hypothetical protein